MNIMQVLDQGKDLYKITKDENRLTYKVAIRILK